MPNNICEKEDSSSCWAISWVGNIGFDWFVVSYMRFKLFQSINKHKLYHFQSTRPRPWLLHRASRQWHSRARAHLKSYLVVCVRCVKKGQLVSYCRYIRTIKYEQNNYRGNIPSTQALQHCFSKAQDTKWFNHDYNHLTPTNCHRDIRSTPVQIPCCLPSLNGFLKRVHSGKVVKHFPHLIPLVVWRQNSPKCPRNLPLTITIYKLQT